MLERVMRFLAILPPVLLFVSCSNCEEEASLRKLIRLNAAKLAQDAIAESDLRFLGVAGYTITVPGIDGNTCIARRNMVRVIEGTSDTPCEKGIQDSATKFARTYNLVVRTHLDGKQVDYMRCFP
jgi:hypothetical protein